MPAVNPRITVTLTPYMHALLQELSRLTGNSQSALVSELLESGQPALERMASLLQAASRLKAEGLQVTQEIRDSMDVAQGRLEQQLDLVLDVMDEAGQPLLQEAERVSRRSGRAQARSRRSATAKAAPTPVPVTRGSGSGGSVKKAAVRGSRRG